MTKITIRRFSPDFLRTKQLRHREGSGQRVAATAPRIARYGLWNI
jgi:hypothetical protein